MKNVVVSNWSLVFAFLLVLVSIGISVKEKLDLTKDILLSVVWAIIQRSIKTAMQPMIDSAKTVGLVNLPGMMSGLIFAGVNSIYAIKYQIMVTFMLLSATSLGAIISVYLAYKNYFNDQMQLML